MEIKPSPPATVGVHEAAIALGVTVRRVQHLVEHGVLARAGRGEVEGLSLERHLLVVAGSRTRPWAEATAWAAISLLCGGSAPWIGASQRSRLRAQLRDMNVDTLVSLARRRARTQYVGGHPAAAGSLRRHVITPRRSYSNSDSIVIDGYISPTQLKVMCDSEHLYPDARGAYVLRATTFNLTVVRDLASKSELVAALDDSAKPEDVAEPARAVLDAALRKFDCLPRQPSR